MTTSPSKEVKTPIPHFSHHLLRRVPAQTFLARALDEDQQRVRHLIDARRRLREGLELGHGRLVEAIDRVLRGVERLCGKQVQVVLQFGVSRGRSEVLLSGYGRVRV